MNRIAERKAASTRPLPPGTEPFSAKIASELLRLARGGTELSLVCAALRKRKTLAQRLGEAAVARLEAVLHETLRGGCLGECDSMDSLCPGRYALLLPGVGLFRARLLAERMQDDFAARAGAGGKGLDISCALSIACVSQADKACAAQLLSRAQAGLDHALAQKNAHIFQEAHTALDAHAALVHPNEKRFLFFGGE
jgi:GGDEF domain-containing protein